MRTIVQRKQHHAHGKGEHRNQRHFSDAVTIRQVACHRRADHRHDAKGHQAEHDLVDTPAEFFSQRLREDANRVEGQRRHAQRDAESGR